MSSLAVLQQVASQGQPQSGSSLDVLNQVAGTPPDFAKNPPPMPKPQTAELDYDTGHGVYEEPGAVGKTVKELGVPAATGLIAGSPPVQYGAGFVSGAGSDVVAHLAAHLPELDKVVKIAKLFGYTSLGAEGASRLLKLLKGDK